MLGIPPPDISRGFVPFLTVALSSSEPQPLQDDMRAFWMMDYVISEQWEHIGSGQILQLA